jgi:DNA helicase-2/ATP-dependent DNA helicase PcrA
MNKLIIACAGAGKTKFIIDDAIRNSLQNHRILITTYTDACEQEIKNKIIKKNGYIPENIIIKTWFSFLINHGIRPYQNLLFDFDIKGMVFVNGRSGVKYSDERGSVYWPERDLEHFYFNKDKRIYSDKIAQLTIKCNEASNGKVFNRLTSCFNYLYIDEVQDLAGYDLEIIDALVILDSPVTLVGDPRQATYSTNNSAKNAKYRKADIVNFFEDKTLEIDIDDQSLIVNYRCVQAICELSNRLYPEFEGAQSGNSTITEHNGVFLLPEELVEEYLNTYKPTQLRHSKKANVNPLLPVYNYGKSKGLTFERTVIYPTRGIVSWVKDNNVELAKQTKSSLYVALTRAQYSVAIIVKKSDLKHIDYLPVYNSQLN